MKLTNITHLKNILKIKYFYHTAFLLEIDSVPEFGGSGGTPATLGAFGGNGGTPAAIPLVVDLRRIDANIELADARRRRSSLNVELVSFLSDFSIFNFYIWSFYYSKFIYFGIS